MIFHFLYFFFIICPDDRFYQLVAYYIFFIQLYMGNAINMS